MRSIAILAGGRATRFDGRDKSALVVDGRAILDRQLDELSPLTDDVMIVGSTARMKGSHAFGNDGKGARAFHASVQAIADIVPGCGPLGGLHAALTAARSDTVFVLACDMPYVSAAFADYLFSLAGGAGIVVPKTERGYHPLCAVYSRACLEPVAAHLAAGRLALRELIDVVPVHVVAEREISRFGRASRLLANVNTPAEYASLEALQGHKL
jgi:molybdopterin-guanine dinucleotide biosynthesis protein A